MRNYTEAVAEGMVAAGVKDVFGLMGAGTIRITHVLTSAGAVRYHAARHEAGAVGAADGYARATRGTGVAMTTWGPAVTNTATALTAALRARTPLVYVAADSSQVAPERNLFAAGTQRIDQRAFMEMLEVPVVRPHPSTVCGDVAHAFDMAQRERTPVVLMLAMEYELSTTWDTPPAPPRVAAPIPIDSAAVERAAAAMNESLRPVILAGRGAVLAGAREALVELAERTGALLATTMRAKDLFYGVPYNLGVAGGYATPVAAELLAQADCVAVFGASLNAYTTRHGRLFKDADLLRCDVETEAIVGHGRPGVALHGDALSVAQGLLDALGSDEPRGGFRGLADAAGVGSGTWRLDFEDMSSEGALDPRAICRRLDELLPRERHVVVDAGGISEHPPTQMTVPAPEALLWLTGDFGAIGTGLAPAIGAAIGRPDRVTVAILGDGGLFLTLPELDLAVRDRVPLLVVCLNDRAYGSEYHHMREDGLPDDVPGATFETPDLAALAVAMGCEGERISTLDQLDAVVARLAGLDRPLLLDCMLTQDLVPSELRKHMRAPGRLRALAMRAVVLDAFGEPDVLVAREWPEPVTGDGEVIIDVRLSGVNFSDTSLRRMGMQTTVDAGGKPNWVRPESLPIVPGGEVVGRVGGQRVVALCGTGGYAQRVAVPVDQLFPIPNDVDDATALCLFVQGLTAWFALRDAARLGPGESLVIQAAAGGVGSLAVQLARELGAGPVVGVASTERKRALAVELGANAAVTPGAGLEARLLEANGGRPYDVVLESSGAPEFAGVCAVLARFGRLVTLGSASGTPGQVETRSLIAGSRSLVGFWLLDYLRPRDRVESALGQLFDLVIRGAIAPLSVTSFALEDAAEAHRKLESGNSVGKAVLEV